MSSKNLPADATRSEIPEDEDPKVAANRKEAVGIERSAGTTVAVGDEANGEWLASDELRPLDLGHYR